MDNQAHLQKITSEEESLFSKVKLAVKEAAIAKQQPRSHFLNRSIKDLRDEAAHAHTRDLPSLFDQLHTQQSLAAIDLDEPLPDMRAPYFAHLQLKESGQIKHLLLGHQTFLSTKHDVKIIDWKHAPIAQIFFQYREGDEYEITLPNRIAKGYVLSRRIIEFDAGNLLGIKLESGRFWRHTCETPWQFDELHKLTPQLSGGAGQAIRQTNLGTGETGRVSADIAALLDPQQYSLLQADENQPLLILGNAGSGKTTVALHRLAAIFYRNPQEFPQHRMLVIVPEEGLVRLSKKLLASLKLDKISVLTYDQWLLRQGKRTFPKLDIKLCNSTPASVIRFKRHRAVLAAFPFLAQRRVQILHQQLKNLIPTADLTQLTFNEDEHASLLAFSVSAEEKLTRQLKQAKEAPFSNQIHVKLAGIFESFRQNLNDLNEERRHIFLNKDIAEKIVSSSHNELNSTITQQLLKHSQSQLNAVASNFYQDFDREFSAALDQQDLNFATPDEIAFTIDIEDITILLLLHNYYTGYNTTGSSSAHHYAHIVIDEAQELSPLELKYIGQCLDNTGSITVAGDAVQQTDPTALFKSWDNVLKDLDVSLVHPEYLTTSYRCPETIIDLAYKVLGPLAPEHPPKTTRKGQSVIWDKYTTEGEAFTIIRQTLEELMINEPKASIAIICKDEDISKQITQILQDIPFVRYIENGDFSFTPGCDIADIPQVKGLEFDYVIIPDANNRNYYESNDNRRALHVAITRAIHQLWIISIGTPSTIIDHCFS